MQTMGSFIRCLGLAVIAKDSKWIFTILNSTKTEALPFSGFSEYQTYGNYLLSKYNLYKHYIYVKWLHYRMNMDILAGDVRSTEKFVFIQSSQAISFVIKNWEDNGIDYKQICFFLKSL